MAMWTLQICNVSFYLHYVFVTYTCCVYVYNPCSQWGFSSQASEHRMSIASKTLSSILALLTFYFYCIIYSNVCAQLLKLSGFVYKQISQN